MENIGTIIKKEDNKIIIQLDGNNTSGCSSCGSKSSCASAGTSPGNRFVELQQHTDLKEGTRVKMEMGEARSIGLAFLLFILPLLIIIAAYVLFDSLKMGEALSILSALGTGALGFFIILKLEDRLMKKMQVTKLGDETPVHIKLLQE